MAEGPFATLDLLFFRHADFEQMADGGGQDVAVALEIIVVTREPPERPRDVGGHGRLFGNDQALGHGLVMISTAKRSVMISRDPVPGQAGFLRQRDSLRGKRRRDRE